MPGELDRVAVGVFDDAVLHRPEEPGQWVANGNSWCRFKKLREIHEFVLLGTVALAKRTLHA
jgi:hypothetical protein